MAESLDTTINSIADSLESFKSEQRNKLDMLETRMSRPGAFTGGDLVSTAPRKVSERERKAFGEMLRTGDRSHALEAKAVVNAGTSGQGLEAVSTWFDDVVLSQARVYSPILKIIGTRNVANFPCKHVVTNAKAMTSGWVGELGTRTDTEPPAPLVVEVPAGEWFAIPAASEWSLTDIAFDVEAWLRSELVAKYSESLQSAIVSGNGTSKPTGFLAGPTPVTTSDATRAFGTLQYIPTGQAAALNTDAIAMFVDTVAALGWQYRANAHWVMNVNTIAAVRKVKDLQGRPVFMDSMIVGVPDMLLGYPVIECPAMPNIGAGLFPIAFGDFSVGYILDSDATGVKITRDEITQKGFVKYYSRKRVGGKILDSDALKLIKVAVS
jgi:HK97 family phage major capsid protein